LLVVEAIQFFSKLQEKIKVQQNWEFSFNNSSICSLNKSNNFSKKFPQKNFLFFSKKENQQFVDLEMQENSENGD